jgi:pilus assembly protein CpaF
LYSSIDTFLVGSLAVRFGLMEDNFEIANNAIQNDSKKELITHELYKQLRDDVQFAIRKQFSIEETDPQQARNTVTRHKFNNIVDYQIKNLRLEIKESDIPVIAEKLFSDILGYGPLEKYFNDPEVTEIKVWGTKIRVEKHGVETEVPEQFDSIEQGVDLVRRMIAKTGKRIDQAEPKVDARLHDGSRLKAQIAPIAVDGLLISIRRFRQDIDRLFLVNTRAISPEAMRFLEVAVQQRLNIMIAGGTSSGKTTWLNVLASFIEPSLSIITIEDPAELQLQHSNVRRLEARDANIEGKGRYTLSDGVKDALRMAPKIIIVGEVRREEAFDLLQAMGTGHKGSLGTGHANSAEHLLNIRLPNMIRMANMGLPNDAILEQIADTLDLVIYVTQEKGGRRRLDHITEVVGPIRAADGRAIEVKSNRLWEYNRYADSWEWVAKDFRFKQIFEEGGWLCPN